MSGTLGGFWSVILGLVVLRWRVSFSCYPFAWLAFGDLRLDI